MMEELQRRLERLEGQVAELTVPEDAMTNAMAQHQRSKEELVEMLKRQLEQAEQRNRQLEAELAELRELVHRQPVELILDDGSKYYGRVKNGRPHGPGKQTDTYGQRKIYEGQWTDGKYDGIGVSFHDTAKKYDGRWKNGQMVGKATAQEMPLGDGSIYAGPLLNGKPHGQGTATWSNGGSCTGEWEHGQLTGEGGADKIPLGDGETYTGPLHNGKPHGQGTARWQNRGTSTGTWEHGQMVGKGTAYMIPLGDGTTYTGPLLDGKPHGQGTSYYQNGNKVYEGQWEMGKKHGQGILYNSSGSSQKRDMVCEGRWATGEMVEEGTAHRLPWKGYHYQGPLRNGIPHGCGTAHWSDGSCKGRWANGEMVGEVRAVKMPLGDGTTYTGRLLDGKPHDQGTVQGSIQLEDRTTYSGPLRNGKPHGRGTASLPTGGSYTGHWENGLQIAAAGWANKLPLADGRRYDGSLFNGMPHGYGTSYQQSGKKDYEGEWRHGKQDGEGTQFNHANDSKAFDGQWVAGKVVGEGKAHRFPWEVYDYEGALLDGKPHGKGTAHWSNPRTGWTGKSTGNWANGQKASGDGKADNMPLEDGSIYTGALLDHKPHGRGTSYCPNRRERYEGEWREGQRNGKGISYQSDGKTKMHEGQWENGQMVGKGTVSKMPLEDGKVYDGQVLNGIPHGQGTSYTESYTHGGGPQSKMDFNGSWQDGKWHGQGTVCDRNGKSMFEGRWEDGLPQEGTFFPHSGGYNQKWRAGERLPAGIPKMLHERWTIP
ncbi:unnamed protein product [Vitrella brassicaformis CCMP3155]|uniref:MORN repeat-containing protein n=1 Tax=Vitrella brassicaformis (strain CCMP3155) TaxID=1169540 RepID=A0A0G4FZS5_VITBC|nr:unnamed protein product [Vitrella brassicaformis CCMP3155]|eukprot:CEM20896.1 unnamed protein product [Vitrella brassicaformis CCMP3155]